MTLEVESVHGGHVPKKVAQIIETGMTDARHKANYTANCSRQYKAIRHSGTRPLDAIKWIVMHSTEGPTARSAAAWFTMPGAQGSTHLVLDDEECYRTLADNQVPWGAPGANYNGFHIEQAGFARWTSLMWSRNHWRMLNRGAYKAALHCRKFGIPPVFVTARGLKADKQGITTHKECTDAFQGGIGHYDPGPGWPRRMFMLMVKRHHKKLAHIKP